MQSRLGRGRRRRIPLEQLPFRHAADQVRQPPAGAGLLELNGAPGVGHPWLVEIELKGNHWNALIDLAVEVGEQQADSRQAFIRKANEADCIGIHEDVLVPFHPLIKEFKIRQAGQRGGRVETVQPR